MKHPLVVPWVLGFLSLTVGFATPARVGASETRVDAFGGLTTVVTDETTDLNLFLDGNPAALVLLPAQSRLDLSSQWATSTTPSGAQLLQEQALSTFARLPNKEIGYQGYLGFLTPQWALQATGDLDNLSNQPAFSDLDRTTQSDSLLLFRTAVNWGPLALGLETRDSQTDQTFSPGFFNNTVGILSGALAQNQWQLKTGLVAHFIEGDSALSARWQVGGFFETNLAPDTQSENLSVYYPSQSPFALQRLFNLSQNTGAAEVYYENPQSLQLRFSAASSSVQTRFSQTVPFSSADFQTLSAYPLSNQGAVSLDGAAKIRIHLSDVDLRIGVDLAAAFLNEKLFQPDGTLLESNRQERIQTAWGIGLDAPEDYTVGIQFQSQNGLGGSLNAQALGATGQGDPDSDAYQIALGGEKWISPEWALRIGILNGIDVERFGNRSQTLSSSVVGGVGMREDGFLLDAKLLLGEIFPLNDASIPDTSQTGLELSGTLFL
jgi:hypothetical protein